MLHCIRKTLSIRIKLTLLIILFCRISFAEDIQGPTPLNTNPPVDLSSHITPGEELTYIASWAGFPAGSIKTKVWKNLKKIDDTELFMFEAMIETNDFVSLFYPIKNTLHSYVEKKTGYSRIFTRKIKEEDYQANDRVDYYYQRKDVLGEPAPELVVSVIHNNTVDKLPPRRIPGMLSDPLGFAWMIRGLTFSTESPRQSILISDRFGTGIITLTLLREEKITLNGKDYFDSYVIKPEASTYDSNQNLLKIEGNATIWIEKHTKIILRAEAESPIGQVGAVLSTYTGTNLDKYLIPVTENPIKEEK